jgi:hypothetical protein
MSFLIQLLKGFIKSGVNQVGRDGGKVISNKVYGNKHSSPVKILSQEEISLKDDLITDICNILGIVTTTTFTDSIKNGFGRGIPVRFNTKEINLETFKEKCQNLYNLILDEDQKNNFQLFYTKVYKTIQNEIKKESLTSKFKDELSEEDLLLLIEGKYFIGMTENMLLDSIGQPDRLEEEVLKTKTKKTYIYGNKSSGDILVFENGKLIKFKDR